MSVVEQNKLRDFYLSSHPERELERSVFKGKILRILPGIQTAFVEFGHRRSGFLHITEVDRTLALQKMVENEDIEDSPPLKDAQVKRAMSMDKIFKEGEEVMVQVIKEPISDKGAKLSTCFTLPGKYLVLMPNIPQIGISKKIGNKEERSRLRNFLSQRLPKEMGAIVRTTAEGRPEKDTVSDLAVLISTWKSILKKYKKAEVGDRVYEDLPVSLRALREHLNDDVEAVICDSEKECSAAKRFIKHFAPDHAGKIKFEADVIPFFGKVDLEKQLDDLLQSKVSLPSGGSLVIESTEAMTVIDVNTGKFTGKGQMEKTILQTNLEAADEIVRQLRLRNIGGLIVIDFINMNKSSNREKLSKSLEKTLRDKDRFQSVTLKVSEFGLVQMTRKRSGKTLAQQLTQGCSSCNSTGLVKSVAFMAHSALDALKRKCLIGVTKKDLTMIVSQSVFDHIVDNEFLALLEFEKKFGIKVILESDTNYVDAKFNIN